MKKEDKIAKKQQELEQQVGELTQDLQRIQADFENYRKRVDIEKKQAEERGEARNALRLLPIIDTIERAILHIPKDIADHSWVKGVGGLIKQLDTSLADMGLVRIKADPGSDFNPELHQAVVMDEEADGDKEVIAEELQSGYQQGTTVLRPSMVKVTRK